MIRAVFDANVLASGLLGYRREESTPGALLRRWFAGDFELITSDPLLVEIQRTLSKPYFASRITPADVALVVVALNDQATRTTITVKVTEVATHPEDDLVLAAALSAEADVLVTGDAMLQQLEQYQGVRIVSPREFLDGLASKNDPAPERPKQS